MTPEEHPLLLEYQEQLASDRELTDAWLTEKIKAIWSENREVYGAPRIHAELRMAHGIQVGRNRERQADPSGAFPGDAESGLRYHEPIARRLREGPPLPKLIVVRDAARLDFLVLVEGHVRVTAFFLFPEMLPPELEIYLGTAEDVDGWGLYG